MRRLVHPHHSTHRRGLRALGVVLTGLGGCLTVIGMVSFFSAFGGGGFSASGGSSGPQLFWCAFLGLPLMGVGTVLLKLGYLGSVARYVASETAPVAADTLDYVARASTVGLREVAGAIGAGLRGAPTGAAQATQATQPCGNCRAPQRLDANFCDRCGTAMTPVGACARCHHQNDAAARFCRSCGAGLTAG
ncbi:MAG: zinc ribbon domain-containing protein [Planctomycetes bacterium]|jgi:hypothetical protein|nr:zinc ribbon domain-containing protein [Planctomycetota bacterium]